MRQQVCCQPPREPEIPTPLQFNHAILAIQVPKDLEAENCFALYDHERLGKLVFFDPTDPLLPLGYSPSALEANHRHEL